MLTLPGSVKILACTQPTDMRKSFSGLATDVRGVMNQDPMGGFLFLFVNARKTQLRILWFERGGYCIHARRLEKGQFRVPWEGEASKSSFELEAGELMMVLEGFDLKAFKRRRRWTPTQGGSIHSSIRHN